MTYKLSLAIIAALSCLIWQGEAAPWSAKIETTTVQSAEDDAVSTVAIDTKTALSKDEDASIVINASSTEKSNRSNEESADIEFDLGELVEISDEAEQRKSSGVEKSGKLLLLSVPRHEKPQQTEENIEEPAEPSDDSPSGGSSTTVASETTTAMIDLDEAKDTKHKDDKVTKLFPIDDMKKGPELIIDEAKKTETDGDKKAMEKSAKLRDEAEDLEGKKNKTPSLKDDTPDGKPEADAPVEKCSDEPSPTGNDAPAVPEQNSELHPRNDNLGTAILVEAETDYVLVDEDFDHDEVVVAFTDADSAEHLQPIVESIEIVPSSLDDAFIVNYVQNWR